MTKQANMAGNESPSNYLGISYLYSLAPWNGAGKFDLQNIRAVLKELGDPQDKVKTVHIAGTNGKGSVSVTVAAMLGASGASVGLTISPHLQSVTERIVIDGLPISINDLDALALEIKGAASRAKATLSFFEAITVAAFCHFEKKKVEYAVIEVGLGGRLDATNVIRCPVCTVITSISHDHEDMLGSTLERIAGEKAGIIKASAPVVIGFVGKSVRDVINKVAIERGSDALFLGEQFSAISDGEAIGFRNKRFENIRIVPTLKGEHQVGNAAVATQAALLVGATEAECIEGIKTTFWPGRLEKARVGEREVLLDGAHNPAGVQALRDYIESEIGTKVELAFGVLSTKRWREMIEILAPVVAEWDILEPPSPACVGASEVERVVSGAGGVVRNFMTDYKRFVTERIFGLYSGLPIVCSGSLYLIGELRTAMGLSTRPLWIRGPVKR